VIDNLLAAQGSRYVWGGNLRGGVPRLLTFYPPARGTPLTPATADLWQLAGVDCSGLLYEATGGFTPRNTSALIAYGTPVPIKGLDAAQIIRLVEPLDLIVWQGHVMIILDRERIIESRLDCHGNGGGVRVRTLREALIEIRQRRIPLDNYPAATAQSVKGFVIRRWFPVGRYCPTGP
jgi:cell wall-associated NlpC family hydrolase